MKQIREGFKGHFLLDKDLNNNHPLLDAEIIRYIKRLPEYELRHMQRVSYLYNVFSSQIAQTSQYQEFAELLSYRELAFFHDIGKAWINPKILMKPKKLSSWEYEQIKQHPVYAQKYIESRPLLFEDGFFIRQLVFNMAVYHHEWWNGKGYPYGMRKEKIPLVARITSICDAYDAITNSRPYRAARTHLDACSEIERWSSQQFDPALVRVFLDCNQLIEEKTAERNCNEKNT